MVGLFGLGCVGFTIWFACFGFGAELGGCGYVDFCCILRRILLFSGVVCRLGFRVWLLFSLL